MTRKLSLAILIVSIVVVGASAQDSVVYEAPFRPMSATVVGQGGSFTANASGWDAFFTNPAGLAGKGSLTLASVNPWVYTTGEMAEFLLAQAGVEIPTGPLFSVAARDISGIVLPDEWELPEGAEDEIVDLLNGILTELGVNEEVTGTVTIPDSWTELIENLDTIAESGDPSVLLPYLEDFLVENPEIADLVNEAMAAEMLPEGFPTSPDLRVGVSAGLGLVVKGFGLGFAAIVDANVAGTTVITASGEATLTVGLMAGYAHEFKFSDWLGLKVGGLLRPMFRVTAPVSLYDVMNAGFGSGGSLDPMALLDSLNARYGTGIGIDLGAILGLGPFNVGVAVSDLFDTRFNYRSSSLLQLYNSIVNEQTLPIGTSIEGTTYVIPMDVRVGASFHPDLGKLSFLVDPQIHFEIGNFLTFARQAAAGEDVVMRFADIAAFGAEVRLLRVLSLRAGYYQGTLSAGVGAKLLFLDANVAAYVAPKEGSSLSLSGFDFGNVGDIGVAAEIALRI